MLFCTIKVSLHVNEAAARQEHTNTKIMRGGIEEDEKTLDEQH